MLAKTCLTLSLLFLLGCGSAPPVESLYIPDFKKNFSEKYVITDIKTLTVKEDSQMPLAAVDGFVCMSPEQYLNLKKWLVKQQAPKK